VTTILRKSGDDYLSEEKWIGQQAMDEDFKCNGTDGTGVECGLSADGYT
jgi:hypothetical protein